MSADDQKYRWTFTITSITEAGVQNVLDDMRKRFGRGPLIHVIGKQPSNSHLRDAPWGPPSTDEVEKLVHDAVHEHGTLRDVIVQSTREAIAAAIVERLHRGADHRLAPVEVSS